MKLKRILLAAPLIAFLVFTTSLSSLVLTVTAQDTNKTALQRGYRTGYSDGYLSGYRDAVENTTRSFAHHRDYLRADRAYNKEYGSLNDYKDGYQQGFERGYVTGNEKRSFNAVLPIDLRRRGINSIPRPDVNYKKPPKITPKSETRTSPATDEPVVVIPTDTELLVELNNNLNTDHNKEGDRFKALIVSPTEINGAIIEGKITKVQKPGRVKRRSELSLSFDRLILTDRRWSNFSASLIQVIPVKGDGVGRLDVEGAVEGQNSVKGDIIKVGAATGTGLVIGAIAGGPVGAAIGAGVGAAFGVGAIIVERGKHVRLTKGQQLRIKTAYETRIR